MGAMYPNIEQKMERRTIAELCGHDAQKIDAVRVQWSRTIKKEDGRTFDRTYCPTDAEIVRLRIGGKPESNSDVRAPKPTKKSVFKSNPVVANVPPPGQHETKQPEPNLVAKADDGWRKFILYTLMLIPAAASVQNMHGVTLDITGHWIAAVLLTGLFSGAPFLFVLAGVKNAPTGALVVCMVVYEGFCNLTRIYGGLTGFGKTGFPTRFLGLVTDVFGTGTHQTAVFLALIMAILAASTFYAAYFELNKNN